MKTVLVTGGSRGIGAETIRVFSREGWKAGFLYKENDEAANDVAAATGAVPVKCDVSDSKSVDASLESVMEKLGADAFDAVVCCAGISLTSQIQDVTDEEWEKVIGTDLTGTFNVVRKVVPGMISKKQGSIVLVSSIWGKSGASCEAPYSAAKAGIIGLGQSLSKELGASGIRVNMVSPGMIDTDMNSGYTESEIKEFVSGTSLGRIGTPGEVAELIYFLASEKASYITGQTVGIDGGLIL